MIEKIRTRTYEELIEDEDYHKFCKSDGKEMEYKKKWYKSNVQSIKKKGKKTMTPRKR